MSSIRDKALKNTEDVQTFPLQEDEVNHLKLLTKTLVFHTYATNIQSGFLYYIATNRLGYAKGADLQFETDLDKEDHMLTVRVLPVAAVDKSEA
jgi:hypothetical protein